MYKRYVRDFDSTHLVIKFLEGAKPEFRVHIDVRPSLLPRSFTVGSSAICWAVPWVRPYRVFNSEHFSCHRLFVTTEIRERGKESVGSPPELFPDSSRATRASLHAPPSSTVPTTVPWPYHALTNTQCGHIGIGEANTRGAPRQPQHQEVHRDPGQHSRTVSPVNFLLCVGAHRACRMTSTPARPSPIHSIS